MSRWRRTPLVLFDVGHTARSGRPGASHGDLREDLLCLEYTARAVDKLRRAGVDAYYAGPGSYRIRQTRAKDMAADAYVCAHVNAGADALRAANNPRRHLALIDHRATLAGGRGLAHCILERSRDVIRHDEAPWTTRDAQEVGWTRHAFELVRHLGPVPGVVLEPGFIDEPNHGHMWTPDGLRTLGDCIAAGVLDFLEARGLSR